MNKIVFKTVFTAMLALPVFAAGGDRVGNGGGAIVCIGADGGIESSRLLDLYEKEIEINNSTNRSGRILDSNASVKEQLRVAVEKLATYNETLSAEVAAELDVLDAKKVINNDTTGRLAPPKDIGVEKLQIENRRCYLTGAASFVDSSEKLILQEDVYQKMSNSDKAALDFHEALYKVLRKKTTSVVSDSRIVRKITGGIFSNTEITDYSSPTDDLDQAGFVCSTGDQSTVFYITNQSKGTRIQITKLKGEELFSKMSLFYPHGLAHAKSESTNFVEKLETGFLQEKVEHLGKFGQLKDSFYADPRNVLSDTSSSPDKSFKEARYFTNKLGENVFVTMTGSDLIDSKNCYTERAAEETEVLRLNKCKIKKSHQVYRFTNGRLKIYTGFGKHFRIDNFSCKDL